MPLSRRATPEDRSGDSAAEVVITERLVATSPETASGTFTAIGAITATGTVLTGSWPWRACRSTTERSFVEGSEKLVTARGELRIDVRLTVRRVSGTGVLTGGGSWNVGAAAGELDGIRAAGSLTVSATVQEDGAATMELMLTGCVPASAGSAAVGG